MEAPFNNYVVNGFITHNSTRYCNYGKDRFGREITVLDIKEGIEIEGKITTPEQFDEIYAVWYLAMEAAEAHYLKLLALGASPQIARSVLPNSTKTEIVMTLNLRSWRNFFQQRATKAAHPQMRQIAVPMLAEFKRLIPIIFDDIKGE